MKNLISVDREIAAALVTAARHGHSGLARCGRGKLRRLFCVDHGRLCFAASNVVEEQFVEYLAKEVGLAPTALVAARVELGSRADAKLGRWLVDRGALGEAAAREARAAHLRALLHDTLDWMDGDCTFERGRPDLADEVTTALAVSDVLYDYARSRPASIDLVRMRIGPPNLTPALAEDAERLLAEIPSLERVRPLLRLCDGSRPVGEIVESADTSIEEAWRTIYGLVLAGIVEPEPRRATTTVRKDQVTRDEILARIERVQGADHYTVLELMPTATGDEIRAAYYFLARRYHPDRFRTGPLANLLAGMETYFTQVTAAYNTLIDPLLRRSYDDQRGEVARPKRAEQNTRELARQNFLYARGLIEKGRYTDAVTSLENALQLDASVASYHLELGRLLARNPRRRDEARAHLERSTALDPALVDGYLAVGELELRAGKTAEAIALFQEVLRWEPGHLEATRRLEEAGASPSSGGGRRGLFGGG